jgi:two-component system cell cycle sensor histidine kinase PleC
MAQILKTQNPKAWPLAEEDDEAVARIAITSDGTIAYASAAFCRFAHAALEDIQNTPASQLIRIQGRKKNVTALEAGDHQIFINGSTEAKQFHFDWLRVPDQQSYLIGVENNLPLAQAETALSLDDMQHFIAMADQCMIITDSGGKILKASPQFYALFGYVASDLERLRLEDLFTAEPDASAASGMQPYETRVSTQNGDVRWMEWRSTHQGDLMYWLGHDVTSLRRQKKALERREKQLGEAESIGRMGHWHWKIGATAMEWSDELYRIFGVEKNHFKPTLETLNGMVHRSDIARLNQGFQRALIEENDYDMEFRILTKNAGTRYIRCEGRCARDSEGEVDALFGIMQDMTERVLYEQELTEAKNTAERAYAARTQFLANMSHELRTPLNAIIGFSEMIERQILGPIGTPKYLEYISGIRESGEHLLDLISDILDMSKIEAGKYELALEELQPAALIKLSMHMMQGRAHEAGVKLASEIEAPEAMKIVADRRAVLQILLNLLSNAVKFSTEKGQVKVILMARENHCLIKVVDNGIGIPANKLASITKPFEQVSASYTRDHEGSGLGLAITKELAELHGGALFIESKLGEGTSVTIRLPYAPPLTPKKSK